MLSTEPNHGSLIHLSPVGSSRKHSYIRNKKESFSMQSQRSSSLLGAILSLLGGALVIYGVFFLPMVYEVSEWLVVDRFFHADGLVSAWQVAAVLLALPLLAVLMFFVLVTSAVSFFRELSPKIFTL